MRLLAVAFFMMGCGAASAAPPALPDPPACADFQTNKTGAVDAACNAAIDNAHDPAAKSVLLFRRAYVFDASGDAKKYQAALDDLNAAIKLESKNYNALHERAYLYNEYGRWAEARADLDAQLALTPDDSQGWQERALSRAKLGDLKGAYDDRNAAVRAGDTSPDAYLARATAAMWVGKFDIAQSDIAHAAGDAKQNADALAAELALWQAHGDKPADACATAAKTGAFQKESVGDCTVAFLAAGNDKDRAGALTNRAMAWLIGRQNQLNWVRDLEVVAALDPSPHALSNLGFAYMDMRHSAAALPLFEKSIAAEPAFYNYAGLAAAKLNTGDLAGAEAAARKSNEYRKNDVAMLVLGDAAYARTKKYGDAKAFWIAAYNLGGHGDDVVARLKDAGVPVPPGPLK
jgi:tetratricopeptide (TPR) repeat protein